MFEFGNRRRARKNTLASRVKKLETKARKKERKEQLLKREQELRDYLATGKKPRK